MPLVRISMRQGKPSDYRRAVGSAVHQAMVEVLNAPATDRFQIITEHPPDGLIYDPHYLGIDRTDDIVIIQITLNPGRSVDLKRQFYRRLAEMLAKDPGIRPEDVFVSLVETPKENVSFGKGEAQYAKE